jgi:hypothetical protein
MHMQQATATPAGIPAAGLMAASAAPVRFATISQAAELRPAFSPAAFRDLRFKAFDRQNSRGDTIKGNGTGPAGVWVQIGAKVLIDLAAFDAWVVSHRVKGE